MFGISAYTQLTTFSTLSVKVLRAIYTIFLSKRASSNEHTMDENIGSNRKFNAELSDYSKTHAEKTGPYAPDLEVDCLVVGAGFGK